MRRAIRELDQTLEVVSLSQAYEAAPVGAPGTPRFVNAAVAVTFDASPSVLKYTFLRPIEARLGRERCADPNAPRTIDIDIALWGMDSIADPAARLEIPDPDVPRLRHLAFPLRDIAPDLVHPAFGASLSDLATRLGPSTEIHPRPDIDLEGQLSASRELRW